MEYLEDVIDDRGGIEKVVLNIGTRAAPHLVQPRGGSDMEARLGRGEVVDVFEGMAPEDRARVERFMHRKDPPMASPLVAPAVEEFQDDYTKGERK